MLPAGYPWARADGFTPGFLETLPCELYDMQADPAERLNLLRANLSGHAFRHDELLRRWWEMESKLQLVLSESSGKPSLRNAEHARQLLEPDASVQGLAIMRVL